MLTGKLLWVFHSIPHAGEFGYDTWPPNHYKVGGGGHNWSEFTVDEENGIAFIPFGSPRFDFYGGDRPGNNLFGNSLVALDATTGKRIWHFQTVHHDLWDYDLPQAPKLLTIRQNGRNIDVVAQASKQGFLYVFERKTGRPIWPIEERPVPKSDIPGEWTSPTQPFPTKPAPFARQSFTAKDINPYLPADERAALVERFKSLRNEGLFTPPSFEGSIQLPGHNGGANFGSSAVDPLRGEMYVVSKSLPTVIRISLPGQGGRGGGALGGGPSGPTITAEQKAKLIAEAQALVANAKGEPVRFPSPYEFMNTNSLSMSAIGPPWSEITAYDLNTGNIKWQIPAGQVNAPPELGIPANTGSHFPRSGPLVTAGGLLFLSTGSDKKLRAYDRETGKEVWSRDLPATSEGMPATYEVSGRQYIVVPVAAGNGQFAARFGGPPPAPAPAPAAAAPTAPEQQGAARQGGAAGGGRGGGRGGASAARPVHGVCAATEIAIEQFRMRFRMQSSDAVCAVCILIRILNFRQGSHRMKRIAGMSVGMVAAAGTLAAGIGVWAQQNPRTQSTVPDGDWRTINRDLAANRYSPLKDINTSNVASLKEAWTFRLGGGASSVPLVVGGVMYVSSGGRVVALDGDTGKEIWAHSLQPVRGSRSGSTAE